MNIVLVEQQLKKDITKFSTKELLQFKSDFDDRYYNTGAETISDAIYDKLVYELEKRHAIPMQIGCKLRACDNATLLPFTLASMNKIKNGESKKIKTWASNQHVDNFVISDKLNGVSCLICYKENGDVKMYTRGDGKTGADISYFSNKIKGIPILKENLNVRGEIIVKDAIYKQKYSTEYKTSLSLIVSVVNAKTLKHPISDVEFVAYEVVSDSISSLPPSGNLTMLKTLGFNVVNHKLASNHQITDEDLCRHLTDRIDASDFSIDGIIIHADKKYDRKNTEANGNPSYAIAYKMVVEEVLTTVETVEWNITRHGYLTPRIKIMPVVLGGATVNWVTGNNAKFIVDNMINAGSMVVVIRSGEIIPKIHRVITKSTTPCLPDVPFLWNETNVDIIANENDDQKIQKLCYFFTTIGIKHVAIGTIRKLYQAGYDDVFKILDITIEDLMKIPTFEEKSSKNIQTNIRAVLENPPDLATVMVASGCFGEGIGIKKMSVICKLLDSNNLKCPTMLDICNLQGFQTKTAKLITDNFNEFVSFYTKLNRYFVVQQKIEEEKDTNLKLQDVVFVFTNFRDETIKFKIESMGGKVADSVTKQTTFVVTPDNFTGNSTKIQKAEKYGINVVNKSFILNKFKL